MGRIFYTLVVFISFLAGVALYLVVQPGWGILFGLGFLSVLLLGFKILNPYSRWVGFILLSLTFGLFRASLAEHHVTPDQIDFYNGQRVTFEGLVTEADVRRDKAKYTISVKSPMTDSSDRKTVSQSLESSINPRSGSVLITLDKYPQYHYGDRVKISGELKTPEEFDGFDYGNYLSRYGIYSVMYYPYMEVLETGQGYLFWRGMYFFQDQFMERINRIFPEPHGSFMAGLLVGARKGIPPELMEKFNITGLTHIIAISGYNITIIIVFVMWFLKALPRKIGFIMALISIILFTLFVGASPAVVRASIMGILGLIALNYGRQNNIHLTVLFSAFLMVLWNPKILWWDVGFQLSFAAVLGLMYVAPFFGRWAEKLPTAFGIREAIQMTLSAQVMALPIIVYQFGRLSLIAPLANLLVAFAIPIAMLLGFLAVLFSFVLGGISLVFGYFAWGVLSYIIQIIEWMAYLPYASVNVTGMQFWMIILYYILLVLVFFWRHQKGRKMADEIGLTK